MMYATLSSGGYTDHVKVVISQGQILYKNESTRKVYIMSLESLGGKVGLKIQIFTLCHGGSDEKIATSIFSLFFCVIRDLSTEAAYMEVLKINCSAPPAKKLKSGAN